MSEIEKILVVYDVVNHLKQCTATQVKCHAKIGIKSVRDSLFVLTSLNKIKCITKKKRPMYYAFDDNQDKDKMIDAAKSLMSHIIGQVQEGVVQKREA
jgi:transcription initiation factor IIE alpha subunit